MDRIFSHYAAVLENVFIFRCNDITFIACSLWHYVYRFSYNLTLIYISLIINRLTLIKLMRGDWVLSVHCWWVMDYCLGWKLMEGNGITAIACSCNSFYLFLMISDYIFACWNGKWMDIECAHVLWLPRLVKYYIYESSLMTLKCSLSGG